MPKFIIKSYLGCKRCGLCNYRKEIVFGRGCLPADILFIGEAPGKTEDLLGIPFIGPAGKLLDKAIQRAKELADLQVAPKYFITNTVSCRPTDSIGGENRPPNSDEVWACFERLQKTYSLVNPKTVIFLGEVARQFLTKAWPSAYNLRHPAYILRKGGVESPEFRQMARDMSAIFKGQEVLNTKLRK